MSEPDQPTRYVLSIIAGAGSEERQYFSLAEAAIAAWKTLPDDEHYNCISEEAVNYPCASVGVETRSGPEAEWHHAGTLVWKKLS